MNWWFVCFSKGQYGCVVWLLVLLQVVRQSDSGSSASCYCHTCCEFVNKFLFFSCTALIWGELPWITVWTSFCLCVCGDLNPQVAKISATDRSLKISFFFFSSTLNCIKRFLDICIKIYCCWVLCVYFLTVSVPQVKYPWEDRHLYFQYHEKSKNLIDKINIWERDFRFSCTVEWRRRSRIYVYTCVSACPMSIKLVSN